MKDITPRALRRLRPHAARVAAGVALVTASSLAELAKPWPIKIVVDQVLGGRPLPAVGFPRSLDAPTLLAWVAGGLVVLFVVLGALSLATDRLTIDVGQRMVQDLRRDLFAHLERLSMRFHQDRPSGELVYRLAADTLALQTIAMNAVFPTLSALLFLVGMVVVMLRLNVELTLLALVVTPFIVLSVRLLGRRVESVATDARLRESDLYATAEASLSVVRLTQAFSAEPAEIGRFERASRASLARHLELYTTQTAYALVVSVLGAAGTAGVLWLGARLVLEARLSVGDLLVFLAYLGSFYAPLSTLSHTFGLVQEARAGLARVFELLDLAPDVVGGDQVLPRAGIRGEISIEGVEFAYQPGVPVLRGVSCVARSGEKLVLVGPSGSGKTTLALLLMRFMDPDRGFIRLDGRDLRHLTLESLRAAFAPVLQPPVIVPGTVRDDVAYGRPCATDEEVVNALRSARLWEVVEALPEGLGTPLAVAGARLSHGERQRLALARALLLDAPILLLDEPTASLDSATERDLLRDLEAARRGRTCIVIGHSAAVLGWADRIAVLRDGRIVALGTPAELRDRPELLADGPDGARAPAG